ncbi:MAG: glycoside hydrolase family 43 protein [Ornithinibacter sp.]
MIHNPVIPGFHPDPSVVRTGDDYFLATSTFAWDPGIALFHSRDLQRWELVGHALPPGTHDLRGLASHEGIWAPDLSHDPASGTFYLTYSVVRSTAARYFDVDNFVVSAPTVRGPWSAPAYLHSVGFDPSLFHDDDGRHWLVALEWDPRQGYEHPGAIVLDEYDPDRRCLVGESRRIYRGGSERGCLEAPHLYRHDGRYYLMAAEGGTGYAHGVTLARSATIEGPYEADPLNPFLTSNPAQIEGRGDPDHLRPRWFNPDAALQKAGHGSLVSTPHGEWYVAHLCARPSGPDHRSMLGRETAVQQVHWSDDGWLRLSTGGTVAQLRTPSPAGAPPSDEAVDLSRRSEFRGPGLDPWFSTLRRPATDDWLTVASDGPGLRLRGGHAVTSRQESSVVATPVQGFTASVETRVDVAPRHLSQCAGLVVIYDERNLLFARIYASESLGCRVAAVLAVEAGVKTEHLDTRQPLPDGPVVLGADLDDGLVRFWWAPGDAPGDHRWLGPALDATFMSDEAVDGFTGTMVGLACVDGYRRDLVATFSHIDLRYPEARR